MIDPSADKLPRLLSHSAHELRTPLSVALGYIGFVLRDKKTTVAESHRLWLETANRACGRLTDLINEMSEFAKLESADTTLNRTPTDLRALLADAIAALPAVVPDREIHVELSTGDGPLIIEADTPRLTKALTAIVFALRLQAVHSAKLFVQEHIRDYAGTAVSWIVIGDAADQVAALRDAGPESLGTFNPCIGGAGISLWIAGQVLNEHGGAIWAHDGDSSSAVVMVSLA